MPPYPTASLAPTVELIDNETSVLAFVGSSGRYVRLSGAAAVAAQELGRADVFVEPTHDGRAFQALADAGVAVLDGYNPAPIGLIPRYRLRGFTLRLPLIKRMDWLRPIVAAVGRPFRSVRSVSLALIWASVMTFAAFTIEANRADGWRAITCLAAILAFHEVSHAVSAAAAGTMPRSIGLGLYFIIPVAYVDYTDVHRLAKADAERVALAGPLADTISVALIALVAPLLGVAAFAAVPFGVALFNANPFLASDVRKASRSAQDRGRGRLAWAIGWTLPVLCIAWRFA